jgi:hypothetical protein
VIARVLGLALLLVGCSDLKAREGKPVNLNVPQAEEQCRVQPELDWCQHGR